MSSSVLQQGGMSSTFLMQSMRIRFSGASHVGLKRQHNEDSYFLPDDDWLAIIADGMGGHASGDVASKMAVETVVEHFRATRETAEITWPYRMNSGERHQITRLLNAIRLANLKIYETAKREEGCRGMGTTIVASLFLDDRVLIAHVGDSRIYRLRDGRLVQMTEDHSLLNDYLRMKKMSSEEIGRFPHKNVIVRALGMRESVQIDVLTEKLQLGDVYLLCSDGLSGMVDDERLAEILTAGHDLDACTEQLIETANQNGGADNITCVLARLEPM
jgi:serine/threonine protein phosphatase PrpC